MHFWKNLHQVRSKSKGWKAKYLKTKGLRHESKNRFRSPRHDEGEP